MDETSRLQSAETTSSPNHAQTKRVVLAVCLMVVAIVLASIVMFGSREFSPQEFDKVINGMSGDAVRKVLGDPDEVIVVSPGIEQWRFDHGKGLATVAQYYVMLQDDHVVNKEIDWW